MVHTDAVRQIWFHPSGEYLLTRSGDIAEVWLLKPESLIAEACSRLNRNLTVLEWEQFIGKDEPYTKTCENLDYPKDHPSNNNLSRESDLNFV